MIRAIATLALVGFAAAQAPVCWKDTHGRGVGTIPESCPPGDDKDAALCYPQCKDGYYGVGPVCWEHCPSGWVDEGALCRKDGSIKTIAKKTYGRGVGKPMVCDPSHVEDAALCYPPCPANFDGVGPVCWESCDGNVDPITGGAICCRNGTICSDKVKDLAAGIPLAVAEALLSGGNSTKIIEAAIQALDSILGFVMPLCDTISDPTAAPVSQAIPELTTVSRRRA